MYRRLSKTSSPGCRCGGFRETIGGSSWRGTLLDHNRAVAEGDDDVLCVILPWRDDVRSDLAAGGQPHRVGKQFVVRIGERTSRAAVIAKHESVHIRVLTHDTLDRRERLGREL